ncbi:6122_t:CDS:2, partial [Racocetra fulgida]
MVVDEKKRYKLETVVDGKKHYKLETVVEAILVEDVGIAEGTGELSL